MRGQPWPDRCKLTKARIPAHHTFVCSPEKSRSLPWRESPFFEAPTLDVRPDSPVRRSRENSRLFGVHLHLKVRVRLGRVVEEEGFKLAVHSLGAWCLGGGPE
jgi:hypothetical protein